MEKQLLYLLDYDLSITEEEIEHRTSAFPCAATISLFDSTSSPRI